MTRVDRWINSRQRKRKEECQDSNREGRARRSNQKQDLLLCTRSVSQDLIHQFSITEIVAIATHPGLPALLLLIQRLILRSNILVIALFNPLSLL